jgi:hypothetical protein
MFISKSQKIDFQARIEVLEMRVDRLARSLNALHDIKTTASDSNQVIAEKMKRSTEGWTPEARAIHGERIRLAWAAKKAAKVKS